MNLEDIKKSRAAALENAYNQLINVLNKKLDLAEVDPEKMKVSLSAYRQAADDSDFILKQLQELLIAEGELVVKKKTNTGGISPEQRGRR